MPPKAHFQRVLIPSSPYDLQSQSKGEFQTVVLTLSVWVDAAAGPLGRGVGRLVAATGLLEDERAVINHVFHNQVDGRCFQRLVSSPELLNNVGVMAVKGAQEEHDNKKKKRRNDDLALRHFQNEAVKPGPKSHNWFVIALELIED